MYDSKRERKQMLPLKTGLSVHQETIPHSSSYTSITLSPLLHTYLCFSAHEWMQSCPVVIPRFPGNRQCTLKMQPLKSVCILSTEGKIELRGWELRSEIILRKSYTLSKYNCKYTLVIKHSGDGDFAP